ncbi:MAG: helix-turn-helix domain-containing protein [Oscillospiraceae bacterium]|nr:helix-turn-helix domain-containing protein [Oscillospiraceae bacterium]
MTYAEKLLHLRKGHGYTQEQLAEVLGVTRQAISRWESGTTMPEAAVLIKICDTFHVSADSLLYDSIDLDDSGASEKSVEAVPAADLSLRPITGQERLRPWMGALLLLAAMLCCMLPGNWLQQSYGLFGLIATELILLALALAYTWLRRLRPAEVFPLRRISIRELFGTLCLSVAVFVVTIFVSNLWATLLPAIYRAEGTQIADFLYSDRGNLLLSLISTVLFAPVCEEALCRGAIFAHFRGLKKPWAVFLINGLFFGIFHMSPLRFWGTAMLGAALTYLMIKKDNLLLPVLMHASNNLLAALMAVCPLAASASILLIGLVLCPLLFVGGLALLDRQPFKKKLFFRASLLPSLVLAVLVGISALFGALHLPEKDSTGLILNTSFTVNENFCQSADFEIDEANTYSLDFSLKATGGTYRYELFSPDGSSLISQEFGGNFSHSLDMYLSEGVYTVKVSFGEDCVGESLSIRFAVNPCPKSPQSA